MKRISILIFSLLSLLVITSCSDFFETDPKDIINENDYIDKDDEMYKGFLGIISRVQEAGDQAILLTDTRGSMLEVTENAPLALKDIYNFANTDGNEYADPTCYYAIIIACNDYINKMAEYHHNVGGMSEAAESDFLSLLSSTIRLKVWAYYTIGRIYGEAYWFDDPLTSIKDLSDTSVFTYCDMKLLTEKCLALLQNGITVDGVHVASDLTMKWYKWLDTENPTETSANMKWQYITPPRIILEAELHSWHANYVDEAAAQADWLWVRDNLLAFMYKIHTTALGGTLDIPGFEQDLLNCNTDADVNNLYLGFAFQTNIPLQSDQDPRNYQSIFFTEEIGNRYQLLSGIIYNYQNNQRNRLVQYLCPTYPSAEAFFLRPSEYGLSLYNESDIRSLTQKRVFNTLGGQPAVTKYYYSYRTSTRNYEYLRENIFEIEPTIIMFRGHDLHFLIAEAENHLGNFRQARAILNMGLNNEFADKQVPADWSNYYTSWFGGNGGYGDVGIVGAAIGTEHPLPLPDETTLTEDQLKQLYDWAIADEHQKEYVAEGKSYSYLCKIADRYANGAFRSGNADAARDSVINRIAPKFTSAAGKQRVSSSIKGDGYFIKWDLKDK